LFIKVSTKSAERGTAELQKVAMVEWVNRYGWPLSCTEQTWAARTQICNATLV